MGACEILNNIATFQENNGLFLQKYSLPLAYEYSVALLSIAMLLRLVQHACLSDNGRLLYMTVQGL